MICANCGKEIINNNDFVISVKNGEGMEFFAKIVLLLLEPARCA